MKILLALDQATNVTGYAIYEDGELFKYGKIKFEGDAIERIHKARVWLEDFIKVLQNNMDENDKIEVILEDIQYQEKYEAGGLSNVQTFKTLAWLQGVLIELLYSKNIKYSTCYASEWKATFGIKGRARTEQKRNAQAYVADKLGIKATQDECDAILIGNHKIVQEDKVYDWS